METKETKQSLRAQAHKIISDSLSDAARDANWAYARDLRAHLADHPIRCHPIIKTLNEGSLSMDDLRFIHLEFREAGVKVFTDALSMAMFNTRQLEPRLEPGSKMAARALLTLNCLDEFGFKPGIGEDGGYIGTPNNAHYPLFEQLLNQMGLSNTEVLSHKPLQCSKDLLEYLEENYDSYPVLLALLAIAEYQAIVFSGALRNAVKSHGINVASGYYQVHGLSTDTCCDAADDDHEEDLWLALVQAVTSDKYSIIANKTEHYLDLWMAFWTELYNHIEKSKTF